MVHQNGISVVNVIFGTQHLSWSFSFSITLSNEYSGLISLGLAGLKLQYFGHLMQRADSLEKILMLLMIEDRRMGPQRIRWLDSFSLSGYEFEQAPGKMVKDREAWHAAVHGLQRVRHDSKRLLLLLLLLLRHFSCV